MNRRPIHPGHSVRTALATTIVALSALSWDAVAQFEVTVDTGTTSQAFNTLITSGTNQPWSNDITLGPGSETLDGWSLFTYTNVAIGDYNAGAGGVNTGKFYSFGTGTSTERAFGGLGSGNAYFGSPAPLAGAVAGYITFAATNNSASTLGKFTLGFDGEQWRNGGATSPAVSVAQTMKFEYGFGATFDTVGAWNAPGGSFDWTSPVFGTGTAAAVDGNAAGLVAGRGGTINGLTWAIGETLWLRWIELNDTGNDHGLAIDNFSLSWETAPPAKNLIWTPISADWNTTDTNWKDTSNDNIVAFTNNDTVTFDSTGQAQPNVQVAAGGVSPNAMTVNVGALETYRISGGAINTNAPLQKQGVGTLELGSAYLGGLNAAAGTVRTLANEVFGDNSQVTLGNNATFDLNHHNETIGALDLTGATITMGAGILAVTGNITVQESPTNTPTTIDGAISVGTGTRNLTVADSMAAEDLIINAGIIGSGRLALFGPGTVRLNGDNSGYSGNFQINTAPAATVIVGSADAPFGTNQIFLNGGIIHAAVPLTGADKLVNSISLGGSGATIEGEDVEVGGQLVLFLLNPQPTAKTLRIDGDTVVTLSGGLANGSANPPAGSNLSIAGTGTAVITGDTSGYTLGFQVGDASALGGKVILDTPTGLGNSTVSLYAFEPVELIIARSEPVGGLNSNGISGVVTLGSGLPGVNPVILTLQPALDAAFYTGTIATAPGFTGGLVKDGAGAQTLSGSLLFDTLTILEGALVLNSPLEDAVITNTSGTLYLVANADGSTLNADSPSGTHIIVDQTLAALNIGADGVVVLGGPPPPPSPAAGLQAVPEPGAFTLLLAGAIGLLGRRRR